MHEKSWLIKLLSPILFSAPDAHLRSLEKMWIDGVMHRSSWEPFITKLNTEWQDIILVVSVSNPKNMVLCR